MPSPAVPAYPLAHEDTTESRNYFIDSPEDRIWTGKEVKTVCGLWLSVCDDDPARRVKGQWRFDRADDQPTCPNCIRIIEVEDDQS